MRWVFYSLLILNVVYLGWHLVARVAPPAPAAVLPVSQAPERLRLLSEAGRASAPSPAGRQAGTPALCLVAGPWAERGQAEQLRADSADVASQGRVHAVTVRQDRLNWVYLPPQSRREEALAALRELQSRGVDSFIVSEGDDANAVSLGYFASEASARGLQVRMRNAGYPAEVRETWRDAVEYWVYYPRPEAEAEARLRALVGAADRGAGLEQAACR